MLYMSQCDCIIWSIRGSNLAPKHVIDAELRAGTASAFRGNGVNCVKVCPELGLKFGIASLISQCVTSGTQRETTAGQKFMSGCIGGAIGQVR